MTAPDAPRATAPLERSRHICCLYETQQERRTSLTAFVREGLQYGERILLIVDEPGGGSIFSDFLVANAEFGPHLKSEQLTLLSAKDAYMSDGVFAPDQVVGMLEAETERAIADGYGGLRVAGSTTWLQRQAKSEQLIEYENKLNAFSPDSPCLVLCQYDRRCSDPELFLKVLAMHPTIVVGTEQYDHFCCLPPTEFVQGDVSEAALRFWLEILTGRKRTEAAFQQQAQIIDQIHDSVISTDLDGYVMSWNKGAERLFGYTAHEALGRHISFVYPVGRHEFLEREVIRPLREKGSHQLNVVMRRSSGEDFSAHLSLSLLKDDQETITGMIGYSVDITEQVKATTALEARARRQAAVARLGQRALAGIDLAELMDEAASVVAETLGVEYCKVLELMPDDKTLLLRAGVGWQSGCVGHSRVDAKTGSQAGYTLLSSQPIIVDDLRTETRFSGPPLLTDHAVVSGVSVIIHGQDQPFGILGAHTTQRRTFTDDSVHFLQTVANVLAEAVVRKRAEERLAYQAHLLANVHDAIVAVDDELTITAWNHAAERLYGWQADEVLGRNVQEVIPSEITEAARVQALQVLGKSGYHRTEVIQYTLAGEPIHVEGTIIALRGDSGHVTGYVTVNRDITQRKQAAQALQQHADRLQVLHEIDRGVLEAQSLEEIAQVALHRMREVVPCPRASVVAFDEVARSGVVLAANVLGETRLGVGARVPLEMFGDIEEFRQGKVNVVNDIQTVSAAPSYIQALIAEGVGSYVNVPLVARGELIGSLNLGSDHPGAFGRADVEVAREVADLMAIAIQQARLFEQLSAAHHQLQVLSRRLVEAQETERQRIAHELHDEIGQTFTAVKINLQALQRLQDEGGIASRLDASIDLVDHAVQQVRDLSLELRPPLLDDLGLVATLRWYADREAQLGGFSAEVVAEPPEIHVRSELETTCFRIVQEAFTNVLRHAEANHVRIEVYRGDAELELMVRDDGVGFDAPVALEAATHGASLGLLGMQERARLAGGLLVIDSQPGRGTEIRARFPVWET